MECLLKNGKELLATIGGDYLNSNIRAIFNQNVILIKYTDKVVYYFRIQDYDSALRTATDVISQISVLIELLIPEEAYFNSEYDMMDSKEVIGMLGGLLTAQENKDYILLADLYELQLAPFFLRIQEYIIGKEDFTYNELMYLGNVEAFKQCDSELGEYLGTLLSPLKVLGHGYFIEYSSCGLMTLALSDESNKKYYLHSNSRVKYEAFELANSWYVEDKSEYIIYGLGLGYHIRELYELDENIEIEVYEADINIIQLACAFTDMIYLITCAKVQIIYDPDYSKLIKKIAKMDKGTEFVIHHPSIRGIKNTDIKEKLENYFIQYSSIKNQHRSLNGNFRVNIKHYDGFVDELKKTFEDKDLYIIAAGPSLDKNYLQLKEVGEKGIILATGTVLKKILGAGITPDYVIVTDANARVYRQIAGLESSGIPILFLSTAYKDFATNYLGKRYMICQKGFQKAEEFAQINSSMTFNTGGSVSTTALDIGITFNCSRIIFLGLDLAFTNNYIHAAETSLRELIVTNDLKQVEDIEGNMIYTSKSLDMYRHWIENRIRDVQRIEIIDATEGGAKIEGMRIMKLSECLSIQIGSV